MARQGKEPAWRKVFLKNLAETGNVSNSCYVAGITRPGAYKARKSDEAFAEAWDVAEEDAIQSHGSGARYTNPQVHAPKPRLPTPQTTPQPRQCRGSRKVDGLRPTRLFPWRVPDASGGWLKGRPATDSVQAGNLFPSQSGGR